MDQKKRTLAIVSTPYHLMVFLFIKDALLSDHETDLILTDKTASLQDLYQSGRLQSVFGQVFFADGKNIKNPYKGSLAMLYESFISNPEFPRLFADRPAPDLKTYSDIFFASPGIPDEISKEIIKTAIRKNRRIRFHRFEDGFASYTKPPVSSVTSSLGRFLYRLLMRFDIRKNEKRLYLFQPQLAEANVADSSATGFSLKKIPNDEARIERVTKQIREIFQFTPKEIPAQYLFLGQGTDNVTNNPKTYASLISEIAEHTGHDNFCIKPHPRGVHDRFDPSLKLYEDTAPFEICFADGQMEDKTLLSYYSTACVSGKLLFHSKCRIIFLYPMAGDSFNEKCDYEDYFAKLQKLYDGVEIARSREQLWEMLG